MDLKLKQKEAIHCKTHAEAKALLKRWKEAGYRWTGEMIHPFGIHTAFYLLEDKKLICATNMQNSVGYEFTIYKYYYQRVYYQSNRKTSGMGKPGRKAIDDSKKKNSRSLTLDETEWKNLQKRAKLSNTSVGRYVSLKLNLHEEKS